MKFSQSRSKDNPAAPQQVRGGAASSALQHSRLQQQQAAHLTAISQSPQQLLQRRQLQALVSQQMSDEEEPLQGKFAGVQQAALEEEEPLQGKFAVLQQAALEEEEPLQGKFDAVQLQLEEEEPLQGKFEPVAVSQRQAEASSNNTGMPDQLKSGIESLSGYAMDDVKVHYNSAKPAAMQAHAYAQGTDIHLAPGQEKHLPHEAWHVVQQKQGRVKATTQLKGEAINDDPGLEHEADVMGAKALQRNSAKAGRDEVAITHVAAGGKTSQRYAAKVIHDKARNHYGDGWGALYGIQNDTQLKDSVPKAVRGSGYINLGEYDAPDAEQVSGDRLFSKECFIAYKNANEPETTLIYHCGPSGKKYYHD